MIVSIESEYPITEDMKDMIVAILNESICPNESLIETFEKLECRGIHDDIVSFGEQPIFFDSVEV